MSKEQMDIPGVQPEEDKDFQFVMELSDRLKRQREVDVERNWQQLQKRVRQETWRFRMWQFVRTAAAVLLLPLLVLSGYLYERLDFWRNIPVKSIELTAAYGVVSKVVLPDGSEVWLNSGSKLVYPERFVGDNREVYLSGEAYFKVESDPEHRFDVCTSEGVTVSAFGTEFNVEAYQEDSQICATLAKGNISVGQGESPDNRILKPGEQAVFDKQKRQLCLQPANLLAVTAWKEGKLVFRRTPMAEVAKQLSRRFHVDIQLEGETLFGYSYSATFTTETLDEILSLLEKTAPIRSEVIEPEQQSDLAFSRKKIVIRPI